MKLISEKQYEIQKSKFISLLYEDFDLKRFLEIKQELAKKHKKARHICFAYSYRRNNITYKKYDDDGEPRGTAGIPILSIIEWHKLENSAIIVIRYFGGTKLGASKLLRTYSKSANLHFLN